MEGGRALRVCFPLGVMSHQRGHRTIARTTADDPSAQIPTRALSFQQIERRTVMRMLRKPGARQRTTRVGRKRLVAPATRKAVAG